MAQQELPHYYSPPTRVVESRRTTQILIYGGTMAGIMAAVQCRRLGRECLVVDPAPLPGGMTCSGLGFTDVGNRHAIGGLAAEFYRRVGAKYGSDWCTAFEPSVAAQVVQEFLESHAVEVVPRQFLQSVASRDGRLRSVTMESGLTVAADLFVDASYEGDLAAQAGVRMTVGRESNRQYGEQLNGAQVGPHHQFPEGIDPYRIRGTPSSGLLPEIEPGPAPVIGEGDCRVQAYCFRMCMTDRASNRRPFPAPRNYDPMRYELLGRVFEKGWEEVFRKFDRIPQGKTDTNNHGPVSSDWIGGSSGWPSGSYRERERLFQAHFDWQCGLYHFLATDPRVPPQVALAFNEWGLAADEFTESGGWPHQIYVREGRRMVSDFVMTEHHCLGEAEVPDPIGLAAYQMDSHNCRRFHDGGSVRNEGDVQKRLPKAYGISYRSIIPASSECPNLLVPCAVSASHIAYGSIRMEPVFMILGQSAAVAAEIALQTGSALQKVPYSDLQSALLQVGQILATEKVVRDQQKGE